MWVESEVSSRVFWEFGMYIGSFWFLVFSFYGSMVFLGLLRGKGVGLIFESFWINIFGNMVYFS